MKALILAAGIGWRLGRGNGRQPKCLLRFGGKSLLERHIEILQSFGVRRLIVGVGYEAEKISAEIERVDPDMPVKTVFNPDFKQGNVVTLWRLREELDSGEDVLLMDADVLYDYRIMEKLVASENANCFLMDRAFEPGEEPVKLCLEEGRIVEFRKNVDDRISWDTQGESVGFFKLSAPEASRLSRVTEAFVANGRVEEFYEEALREMVLEDEGYGFGVEDVTGLPWIEIDYPEDIERAQHEVLPRLKETLKA